MGLVVHPQSLWHWRSSNKCELFQNKNSSFGKYLELNTVEGEHVHGVQPNVYDWDQVLHECRRRPGTFEYLDISARIRKKLLESARISYNQIESARINMFVIKIRLRMKKEQTEWLMEVFNFLFGMMVILVMVLVMIINHHQNWIRQLGPLSHLQVMTRQRKLGPGLGHLPPLEALSTCMLKAISLFLCHHYINS